jgi:hypothetical protein
MKVKIIKNNSKLSEYDQYVGQIFEVLKEMPLGYYLPTPSRENPTWSERTLWRNDEVEVLPEESQGESR